MTLVTTATELGRLMRCIGSRLMPAAIPPDYDTDARDEGNAADWLAEQLFNGADVPVGTKAPNGWVVTDDMVEHVRLYLDALDCGDMQVVTTFAGDGWEVRGRADHIKYRDGVLTVDDLKYGHRIVSPLENWTLIAHAIGWSLANKILPLRVVLRIIQPRPYHVDGPVREWVVPDVYGENGLWHRYGRIVDRLSNPDNTLTTGIEQCVRCHARYDCPAFDRAAWNALDVVMDAFHDDMSNNVLAYEHEQFQHAEQIIKTKREATEELMTFRIKSGQVIEGYALEQRHGQRKWAPGMTGALLSATTGKNLTKDGIVTPAEAERRGVDPGVIASLTTRPLIGSKLSKVDPNAMVRRVFG